MRHHKRFVFGARFSFLAMFIGALVVSVYGVETASALTKEAAVENCRQTVGRPTVQGCMKGGAAIWRHAERWPNPK